MPELSRFDLDLLQSLRTAKRTVQQLAATHQVHQEKVRRALVTMRGAGLCRVRGRRGGRLWTLQPAGRTAVEQADVCVVPGCLGRRVFKSGGCTAHPMGAQEVRRG